MATSKKVNTDMVELTLTMKQAFYLRQVLWNVGGSPKGPRGLMDSISSELGKYKGDFEDLELPELVIQGSVIMNNYEEKA